jgi:thymidylate synthase
MNQEEKNYLDLLQYIIDKGEEKPDRTGIGIYSMFGTTLRFSLRDGKVPMFTTKKLFLKGVVEELLFFLRGESDTKILEAKGVNIWKGNTTREFLDKINLKHFPEGYMGKMYGHCWRNFGGHDDIVDYKAGPYKVGVDQISNVINLLKNDPNSRRIVVNSWNASDLNQMVLAPCHPLFQFYVTNNELSCCFYMRSVDTFLGLPFNLLSYAILTHILAKTTGMKTKEIIFMGGDTHVYKTHLEQVKLQTSREPFEFPTLQINKELNSIEDIEQLQFSDFKVEGYQSHSAIKAEMAV